MGKNKPATEEQEYSFWEHLEVLRWSLIRIISVLLVLLIAVFIGYKVIFSEILLSPLNSDFISYRVLKTILSFFGFSATLITDFKIQLINYQLSGQFLLQMGASLVVALVLAFPYILYEIWRFVQPALYDSESKSVGSIFFFSSFLFYLGAAVSYFIIFPLTIRFLGTYQVSDLIPNQISIQSYFNALVILVLSMGLVFEMPILSYFLSKIGIINRKMLAAGRKYAFVVILIVAAVITPTTDPFTLMVVTVPLYALYEVSIWVCKRNEEKKKDEDDE